MLEILNQSPRKLLQKSLDIQGWDGENLIKSSTVTEVDGTYLFQNTPDYTQTAYMRIPSTETPSLNTYPPKAEISITMSVQKLLLGSNFIAWSRYDQGYNHESYLVGIDNSLGIILAYNNNIYPTTGKIKLNETFTIKTTRDSNTIMIHLNDSLILTKSIANGTLVVNTGIDWVLGNYLAGDVPLTPSFAGKCNWTLNNFTIKTI